MITKYSNVKIPMNTVLGATVQALSTRNGTSLTRVTEEGRDDLVVEQKGRVVHIAWSQVKGGIVEGTKMVSPPRPVADEPEAAAEVEPVPVDDRVRVTKRKATG